MRHRFKEHPEFLCLDNFTRIHRSAQLAQISLIDNCYNDDGAYDYWELTFIIHGAPVKYVTTAQVDEILKKLNFDEK